VSSLSHTFIDNCASLSVVVPYQFALCGLWALITLLWVYFVFFKFKRHSLYL